MGLSKPIITTETDISGIATTLAEIKAATQESGAIKSIQRGTASSVDTGNITITLSTVNPDKCMVLLNNRLLRGSGEYGVTYGSFVTNLTEDALTITSNYHINSSIYTYGNIGWQVIEFV